MLLFVAGTAAIAQQAAIEGQVAIHNSEYITGKVQYVEGAFVGALNTTTQPTDKRGGSNSNLPASTAAIS